MVLKTLTAVLLTLVTGQLARAAISDLPAAITGRYNVTFALLSVPLEHATSLLREDYSTILPPDEALYPGIGDNVPLFIELGREANAGPPLLNIENFQEAKIEIPNVKRLDDSDAPFLYKRWIAVDDDLDVIGSWFQFGLNTSKEVFVPTNSSNATSFDYTISGALDAKFQQVQSTTWPLSTFQAAGGQPWFAEYLTCAQHFYNESAVPITYLAGNVTLHPPYAGANATGPITYQAQAVHGIFDFKIVGPLACSSFV